MLAPVCNLSSQEAKAADLCEFEVVRATEGVLSQSFFLFLSWVSAQLWGPFHSHWSHLHSLSQLSLALLSRSTTASSLLCICNFLQVIDHFLLVNFWGHHRAFYRLSQAFRSAAELRQSFRGATGPCFHLFLRSSAVMQPSVGWDMFSSSVWRSSWLAQYPLNWKA